MTERVRATCAEKLIVTVWAMRAGAGLRNDEVFGWLPRDYRARELGRGPKRLELAREPKQRASIGGGELHAIDDQGKAQRALKAAFADPVRAAGLPFDHTERMQQSINRSNPQSGD